MDVFNFIDVRPVTRNYHASHQLHISVSEATSSFYVTVYLSLTVMANSSNTPKTDIASLMWEFENMDVQDDDYTSKVEKILKSLNDLRTDEVTTLMSPDKLVEWNNYVTGLENIIRSGSENSNEVNTPSAVCTSDSTLDETRTRARNVRACGISSERADLSAFCATYSKLDETRMRDRKVILYGATMKGLEFIPVILDDIFSRDNDSDTDPEMPPLEKTKKKKGYSDEDKDNDDLPPLEKIE